MTSRTLFSPICLALMFSLGVLTSLPAHAADAKSGQPKQHVVAYKRLSTAEYQNFLGNWDEKKDPVFYAALQTPAQYDAAFHPAPVMGAKRPFKPEAAVFDKELILVVARVMVAPENMDKVFDVERITTKGSELLINYRFNDPQSNATSSVKNFLAVQVAKGDYKKVSFVENGKPVGELNLASGQWSVPALSEEAKKAGGK